MHPPDEREELIGQILAERRQENNACASGLPIRQLIPA